MRSESSKTSGVPMVATVTFLLLSVLFLSGCSDNGSGPDKNEVIDKGTYTLTTERTCLWGYPGGCTLYVLSMEPSEDFEGDVQLTVEADPALHVQLFNETLTVAKTVSEVEVYPDTTIEIINEREQIIDTLLVIAEHSGIQDTLALEIRIGVPNVIAKSYATGLHNVFIQWIQEEHPELGITTDQEWFSWCPNPRFFKGGLLEGGEANWVFLNLQWEVRVSWVASASEPGWALIRRRGDISPFFAFKRDRYDMPFHEIPVEDFIFVGSIECM